MSTDSTPIALQVHCVAGAADYTVAYLLAAELERSCGLRLWGHYAVIHEGPVTWRQDPDTWLMIAEQTVWVRERAHE